MSSDTNQNFGPDNLEATLNKGARDLKRLSISYRTRGKHAKADEIDRVVLEFTFNRGDRLNRPAA